MSDSFEAKLVPYDKLLLFGEESIGSGVFGDVFKGVHKDSGQLVAFKKLQKNAVRSAR